MNPELLARKLGMDNAMRGELLAVVVVFNRTNAPADAYQVEIDDAIRTAVTGG